MGTSEGGTRDPQGRLNRPELEAHARVAPAFVDRLCELGILAPAADGTFGSGDAFRVRLLEACDRACLTLD